MRRSFATVVLTTGAMLVALNPVTTPMAVAAALPDLQAPGPHTVSATVYDFGDTGLTLPGWGGPVEFRGIVHAPAGARGRRLPLVMFLHGRHATCADAKGATRLRWPCAAGERTIDNYRGYDYLASQLASHGYVVASISANGINAADNASVDFGATARAQLVDRHLARFKQWNTTGGAPFGQDLVGAVDPRRVGLMGHSRGGEGVAKFMVLRPNADFTVNAVLPLAPTDFARHVVTDVALAVALPTCDGDVSNLQGVHLVDDGRYAKPADTGAKYTVTVGGANHNYFNTVWSPSSGVPGSRDDAGSRPAGSVCHRDAAGRIGETRQRQNAVAYVNGFFRYHLGAEAAIEPLWAGAEIPAGGDNVQVSRHPAGGPPHRLVINRLEAPGDLSTNELGGPVGVRGLVEPGMCATVNPRTRTVCLTVSRPVPSTSEPHTASSGRGSQPIFKASWTAAGGVLTNAVPAAHGDFSGYRAIQLRAVVDFSDSRNPVDAPRSLVFTLTDAVGRSAHVTHGGPALLFPPLGQVPARSDRAPHFLLNQVRVPLAAFTGVDLTNVRQVGIGFPGASGSIGLSDLLLSG
jgi:hypothetical protein